MMHVRHWDRRYQLIAATIKDVPPAEIEISLLLTEVRFLTRNFVDMCSLMERSTKHCCYGYNGSEGSRQNEQNSIVGYKLDRDRN